MMIGRLIAASRYVVLLAIVSLYATSVALIFYSTVETFEVIRGAFSSDISQKGAKILALAFIELTDFFLIAIVLYITAAGLYELFISDNLPLLPKWLVIHSLDDLKNSLISVVIVVLSVQFLGQVVAWDGTRDLLGYGVAISAVIGVLTWFLSQKSKKSKDTGTDDLP